MDTNGKTFINRAKTKFGDKFDLSRVEYTHSQKKIEVGCPIHGFFLVTPSNFLQNKHGCRKCGDVKKSVQRKISKEEAIKRILNVHRGKVLTDENFRFNKIEDKVTVICPTHGYFSSVLNQIFQKHGCPTCGTTGILSLDTVIKRIENKWGKERWKLDRLNYVNNRTKIEIRCPVHGYFHTRLQNFVNDMQGCPKCSRSNFEEKIAAILDKRKIEYVSQKKYPDCKGIKRRLPFDFYLSDYDLLIECQGPQHFKPIFGQYPFEVTQRDDLIKKEFCLKKDIPLLEIKFEEIVKAEQLIDDFINQL